MRGTCRVCGKKIAPDAGHCALCACRADGFDSGSNYSDDFEGVTTTAAVEFFNGHREEYAGVAIRECGIFGAQSYLDGVVKGLMRAAERNAERAHDESGAEA